MINQLLYDTGIWAYGCTIRVASLFHAKAKLFVQGRKNILERIARQLEPDKRKKIWIHCASLGEFEQGRPVMEALKIRYPDTSIVLTFFSPSGYEVRKDYPGADHVFYLPLDRRQYAEKFIDIVQPECALFVKYEFWYHYLSELYRRQIPALLFSAIFQARQPFFKWYGGLYRKMLGYYRQLFVQDEASLRLLETLGIHNVQIAGDTRFDRAARVLEENRSFPAIENFKEGHQLIVAGSTWQEDELLLEKAFRQLPEHYKLLIAPHETDEAHISRILALFPGESCLWTADEETFRKSQVCIVHTVGQLAYLYKYADVVWIGGGFTRSGIHNIIEPAVFGRPVCFGPRYERYREAVEMIAAGAALSLPDADAFAKALLHKEALQLMGRNAVQYVNNQLGATACIMHYLSEKCLLSMA